MLHSVYNAFNLSRNGIPPDAFGNGLINHTFKILDKGKWYILQRINSKIFVNPNAIATNVEEVYTYLQQHYPDYLFVAYLKTIKNEAIYFDPEEGYFRLSYFVEGSHTIDVVEHPSQAFEAANQFGKLTKLLAGFVVNKLQISLPDFHNLSLRYQQFEMALLNGNPERLLLSKHLIKQIIANSNIVKRFEDIKINPAFKLRATHHDTKISNVLFNEHNKGLCVIDLDTLMPGYFISDVGDMLRTYLSPVSEEEKDFFKIEIREEYFVAVATGYFGQLKNDLSEIEKKHFVYAGKFMIYMQAIRFLTDYINNDIYYRTNYEHHNLVRAENQLVLLQKLIDKEADLQKIITSILISASNDKFDNYL